MLLGCSLLKSGVVRVMVVALSVFIVFPSTVFSVDISVSMCFKYTDSDLVL